MAEAEMVTEMGATVKELADLRKRHVCLRTRAERVAGGIRQVASRLDEAATGRPRIRVERENLAELWADIDAVKPLIAELTQTHLRIGELETRLREWDVLVEKG